jgi:hypothetical protein
MKKLIVLSIVLGVMGSGSLFLKESTADANLSGKEMQQEQVAKAPAKYSTNIIWFIG